MRGRWSPDQIVRLRQLADDGATIRQAATELGRSYWAVKHKTWMLGIRGMRGGEPKPTRPALEVTRLGGYTLHFTATERSALCMIACGMTNDEIGERLRLNAWQVRYVVGCIFTKTGSPNRTRAALWAIREGVITIECAWEQTPDTQPVPVEPVQPERKPAQRRKRADTLHTLNGDANTVHEGQRWPPFGTHAKRA